MLKKYSFITLLLCNFLLSATNENTEIEKVSIEKIGTTQLLVGPGLAFLGPVVAPGAQMKVGFNLTDSSAGSSYLGFELGFYTASANALLKSMGTTSNLNIGFLSIPIAFTGYYRFNLGESIFHPKVGASIGPNLLALSYEGMPGSVMLIGLVAVAKPGIDVDISKDIMVSFEPQFGILMNAFVFVPALSVGFTL